jgi:hypothetical protein
MTTPTTPAESREGLNPATGKPWRLSDKQVKQELSAELDQIRQNPLMAVEFLQDVGILTDGGRLSRRYGGR